MKDKQNRKDKEIMRMLKQSNDNLDWLDKHYDKLKAKCNNKTIAIDKRKVIGVDSNYFKLLERLRKERVDISTTTFESFSDIDIVYSDLGLNL